MITYGIVPYIKDALMEEAQITFGYKFDVTSTTKVRK